MRKRLSKISALAAVGCICWLAGCDKRKTMQACANPTNPPVGDVVKVSEDGTRFMPLISGKYHFKLSPVYTNYQDAVNRLWNYRNSNMQKTEPEPGPDDFKWRD